MELGRKIWNQYLNLSERGITFELSKIRKNVAVVRIVWQHPTEVKDVLYSVKMGLVYRQSEKIAIPLPLPKISILVHRDEKMTVEQLRENYNADPELQAMLEKIEKLGLSYAMGERAQMELPGMEKEAEAEPADMEAREINLLAEEQAADQAADAENTEKSIKVVRKRKR
jgi:hypothetical protein